MMWLADVKIALASLRATRVRTVLTIFGIIIGVTAVTLVLAFGEGAKNAITNQVSLLGGDVATVRPGKLSRDTSGNVTGYDIMANVNASTLTEYDVEVVESTPGVASATPIMGLRGPVASANYSTDDTQIVATNQQMVEVLGQRVKTGEFVNPDINRNTVVLGNTLANRLLDSDQTTGQKVSIRGEDYTVIGVLAFNETPLALNGLFDSNMAAYVTLDAGKAMNQGIAQIQTINFRADDGSDLETVKTDVRQRLVEARKVDDVAVISSREALSITEGIFSTITQYTAGVAAISLLVGGIGVMNIMLVAVSERTREIGIRKAVGATNGQVLRQFLVEAIIMSLSGGLIGVGLASLLAFGASFQLPFTPVVTWEIFGSAMAVSLLVGVVFGVFPAARAARKDPIEALRQLQ